MPRSQQVITHLAHRTLSSGQSRYHMRRASRVAMRISDGEGEPHLLHEGYVYHIIGDAGALAARDLEPYTQLALRGYFVFDAL